MIRTFLAIALFLSVLPAATKADVRDADAEMFPPDVRYDESIPTPAEFLGFELGRHPVRHHQLVDYLERVAALSDRMTVETIGYSHERRPILFLVVTAPENQSRIDEIQRQHVALSEPSAATTVSDDMPVVSWVNYGVHGAESSGLDAVVPFVYHLAAAQDATTINTLENSVVLITAIFNPDGHAKRIAWFDSYGGKRMISDPAHKEHDFNWTWARTNHYGFDLNRQWLLLTQPEPRAWMSKWHAWRPNLTVDYHEMGSNSTYYFHPGVKTRTNPLVPDRAEELMNLTVQGARDFLDSEARLYFHGESFDNFYIGKGSTFPLVNGGVGVLYEAGAALGREIETDSGLRTYRENIRKQFRTSIASIETAVELRSEYLDYQKSFYANALETGRSSRTAGWVVSAEGDQARLHFFADLLSRHRIESYRLKESIELDGVRFEAEESLLIPAAQAQNTLIRSLFEPVTEFEDNTFYDVSTWTLPPAFGLQAAPLASRSLRTGLGEAWVPDAPSAAAPARASYGYAFDWDHYYAPRAVFELLEAGVRVRAAKKPASLTTDTGVVNLAPGAIFIPFDRQDVSRDQIHERLSTLAQRDGIEIHAISKGTSAIGTAGIEPGGPSFEPLEKPEILLLTGHRGSIYDAGEIWHLLDERMNIPVTLRDRDRLRGVDLDRYSHIIFPAGAWGDYDAPFADRLRQWIRNGGTAVAFRNASSWLAEQTLLRDDDTPGNDSNGAADDAAEDDEAPRRIPYAQKEASEVVDLLRGAIFRADLDITHPIGFGYERRDLFLHKNTDEPLFRPENRFAVVIEYTDAPLYSGYASDTNIEKLAGTPALLAERYGAGSVILFADNPNFRGYWYGTNKLFLNTLFFGTAFDAPRNR